MGYFEDEADEEYWLEQAEELGEDLDVDTREKTGMLRSWTGASDDDLSETFFRVQPDGGADSDDKEYDGQ